MTTRPWMPLYIADYRADTAHLSAAQHGAYLQLIMHYWTTGGLPSEDGPLARIACMTAAEWRKAKPTIAAFFENGWKHKRVDEELAKAIEISGKRRASAQQRHSKSDANALQLDTHAGATSQSQSPSEAKASAPEDPKVELFKRGRVVLGPKAGALISKVLKSCGPEDDPRTIAKARAHIETASTKASASEWIGRILSPQNKGGMLFTETGEAWPDGQC